MTARRIFHLTGPRNGPWLAAELFLRRAAGDVEALCQLALQPVPDWRVGPDLELADQRVAMQLGQIAGASRAHVEVHEPAAQRVRIHPFGHGLVVRVRHQQRETEAVQQPLGGTLPVAMLLADLQQLAGERHRALRQPQCLAQGCANLHLPVVDVAAPPFQALDLGRERVVPGPALAQAHAVLGERVLQLGVATAQFLARGLEPPSLAGESLGVGCGRFAQCGGELAVAARLLLPLLAQGLLLADLRRESLQPVTAVLADGLLDFVDLPPLLALPCLQLSDLPIVLLPFLRETFEASLEQFELQPREVRAQRVATVPRGSASRADRSRRPGA